MDSYKEVQEILKKYKFKKNEEAEFWEIIYPIFWSESFQERMTDKFPHHDDTSLGHHIVADAAVTYKISHMPVYKKMNVDISLAVIIAMFHDLYTLSWQNNPDNFQKYSYNAHGYRHPLEATVNAISWFPEYFKDQVQAEKLIDGIIHHMYPFPVRRIDNGEIELKNEELFISLPQNLKDEMITSSNRGFKTKHFSICSSKFIEGRIMSFSDKKVAIFDDMIDSFRKQGFKTFHSLPALVTGFNKNLSGYEEAKDLKDRKRR